MRKTVFVILLLIFTLSITLLGCGTEEKGVNDTRIKVYTTLSPFNEFAAQIGGEYVTAKNILPPGVSPHYFEPTVQDMEQLMNSDLFLYNGIGLEHWIENVLENLKGKKTLTVDVSKGIVAIEKKQVASGDHNSENNNATKDEHEHAIDPHTWLSPKNAQIQAENIKNALVKLDPNHQDYYENNYQELVKKLQELDNKFQTELKETKRKDFFVSHAAFGYLARDYNLVQNSLTGIIPQDEPTPLELKDIVKKAKELNIHYLLLDPQDKTKVAEVIAKEINADIKNIYTVGSLTKEQIANKEDYFTLMEKNLEVLKQALNE